MIDDWKTWRKSERALRISEIHGVIQTVLCNFSCEFHLKVEILQPLENTVHSYRGENSSLPGSCVLKASVDRVSVDTLGRYVDRQSADMSTEYRPRCRSTCRPSIGRHVVRVNGPSVDTIGRYVGRHSADISADMSLVYRSTVGGIGVLLIVVLLK